MCCFNIALVLVLKNVEDIQYILVFVTGLIIINLIFIFNVGIVLTVCYYKDFYKLKVKIYKFINYKLIRYLVGCDFYRNAV